MVRIIPFEPRYANDFRRLNEAWIQKFFEIEEMDRTMLNDPQLSIMDKGGRILMAELDGIVVGNCALLKKDIETYELAKMAVTPKAQGQKVGLMLGEAILDLATDLGAKKVYLETNRVLGPAIALYKKLGFQVVEGYCSPYDRCDLNMEIKF